jgi:hypothetical protein
MNGDRTTLQGNLRCLAKYVLAKDPKATIALHALEAADRIDELEGAIDAAPNAALIARCKDLLAIWDAAPFGQISKEEHDAHLALRNLGPTLARILVDGQ